MSVANVYRGGSLHKRDAGGVDGVGGEHLDGEVPHHGLHIEAAGPLPLPLLSVLRQGCWTADVVEGRHKLKVQPPPLAHNISDEARGGSERDGDVDVGSVCVDTHLLLPHIGRHCCALAGLPPAFLRYLLFALQGYRILNTRDGPHSEVKHAHNVLSKLVGLFEQQELGNSPSAVGYVVGMWCLPGRDSRYDLQSHVQHRVLFALFMQEGIAGGDFFRGRFTVVHTDVIKTIQDQNSKRNPHHFRGLSLFCVPTITLYEYLTA